MSTDTELSNHPVSGTVRRLLQVCAVFATVAGAASSAHANKPYGRTIADAYHCEAEVDTFHGATDAWKWLDDALKSGKVFSAACKAEFDTRFQACLKDPQMASQLKDPEANHGIPNRVCHEEVFAGILDQIDNDRLTKKRAADEAKAKAEDDAKRAAEIAAREVPKAEMHDAKLEAAIKKAYELDYHGVNKVLKVVLQGWEDDYEKDAFDRVTGRDMNATVVNKQPDGKCSLHSEMFLQHGNGRSFSGPFELRGAGSAHDAEILCEKVESTAKAAPARAKKAK